LESNSEKSGSERSRRISAAIEKAAEGGVNWGRIGLGEPYPELDPKFLELLRADESVAIDELRAKLAVPSTFLVAHIALTQLVNSREYWMKSRANGIDVWFNGLTVQVDVDEMSGPRKWSVSFPHLVRERLELMLFWELESGLSH